MIAVENPQEAALDATLLLKTAEIGSQKFQKMDLGVNVFQFNEFVNRVANKIKTSDESNPWSSLKPLVRKCTQRPSTCAFMYHDLK